VRLLLVFVNLALVFLLAYLSWWLWFGGSFLNEVVNISREDPSEYVPKNQRLPTLPASFYQAVKMLARVPATAAPTTTEERAPTPIRTAVLGVIHQFLGVLYDRTDKDKCGVFVVARRQDGRYTKLVGVFLKVGDLVVENPKIWLAAVEEKVPNLRYNFVFRDEKGKTAVIPLSLE